MTSDESQSAGRKPIPPATRKRLQQSFAHGSKQAAQDNFDYATELFTQCVQGDVDNRLYWQSFFGNLYKKYGNNKKGAKLASFRAGGDRAGLKKAQIQKNWTGVIQHGIEILKLNPWDSSTLLSMAAAGEELRLNEVPLVFLHSALSAAPRDIEVNRAAAKALRARRQYDQASACWQRVLDAKPGDPEAMHEMADLAVEKTIDHAGYEDATSSRDVATEKTTYDQPERSQEADTPVGRLKRAIQKDPSDMEPYLELADMYLGDEDFAKAEEVLARAYEVSDHDEDVGEKLEDARLRGLRKGLRDAEAAYRANKTDEAKQAWKAVRRQYDERNLEAAEHRCRRYPGNLNYHFQLGEAYQAVGKYREAITSFQQARNDPRRKGVCSLHLGQCFHKIKQPNLAATNYEAAIAEISDQDHGNKKAVLYCAGCLALEGNDLDKAEQHLTTLAGMDFDYKDVAALLDKIAKLRNNV